MILRVWLLSAVTLLSLFVDVAYAWNALTHYHINRSLNVEPSDIFSINGTGPDMSIQILGSDPLVPDESDNPQNWPDYFHSPNPKIVRNSRPYSQTPNFAYLMLKTSERNGIASADARARALGWGGHIAADWVAHNDYLFPICPDGSAGSIKHFAGEVICETYSFLSKGPVSSAGALSVAFDDRQLYKALYNYRLISIYESYKEQNKELLDQKLKEKALQTTLPRPYIRERIKRWVAKLATVQFAYSYGVGSWSLPKRAQFMRAMEQRGILSNLALSEMAVNSWINNPTPRGNIPDYGKQVASFYKEPLIDVPSASGAGITLSTRPASSSTTGPSATSIEQADAALWEGIMDAACRQGHLTIEATETPDGLYRVDVAVEDKEALWKTITESLDSAVRQSPSSQVAALFWDRLLVEGVSDPSLAIDVTAPAITIVSPTDGASVNTSLPTLKVLVDDGLDGSGVDPGDVSISIDGVPVMAITDGIAITYKPANRLSDGGHRVQVSVTDRAGNRKRTEWSFAVNTGAPKLCYRVKSRVISKTKPRIEVAVMSNKPVKYTVTVHPVADDGTMQETVVYERQCEQLRVLSWDGLASNGAKASPGSYVMKIKATDQAGSSRTLTVPMKIDSKN